jgi:hypothetical protein
MHVLLRLQHMVGVWWAPPRSCAPEGSRKACIKTYAGALHAAQSPSAVTACCLPCTANVNMSLNISESRALDLFHECLADSVAAARAGNPKVDGCLAVVAMRSRSYILGA